MKRRRYFQNNSMCILTLLFALWASFVWGQSATERTLSFYNTHTQERLMVTYKKDDVYIPGAMNKISHILRDHRTGEIHQIDPQLMDFLYDLLTAVGNHSEVHIISGYRSPKTNHKLRGRSKGVAARSLHMKGKALDFRLPGTDTAALRDTARAMKRGGVGYYRKLDFVQIDTGRVRYW
ncbi:MAG: DUF882 domain-containing protein [Desulfobacterales bacterium]|nr:DUF882 domain-containing protein [Desulfobacterales bacterium]